MESSAFDAFYRATAHRMLRFALAMCGDLAEAQDATQEAYIRCWQRWPDVSAHPQPEAWLRTVITHLLTDRWRQLGVRRRAAAQARPRDPAPPPSEDGVVLAQALRRIPGRQRRAIVMHYLLDMPIAEIAAETGHSANTVKSWLSRGRTSLAAALGGTWEDHHVQ
jgi:RNA polymerase sigma-70 factor (ECF subfamily)